MIVMLSAGDLIVDFSIIGAHVSAHEGEYTNISNLWLHVNGVLLPLIISFLYLIFYKREPERTFCRIFSFYIGLIPIAFMNDNAPVNDDVIKFLLNLSQTDSPLIVSIVAALLIGIGVVLMIKKGVLKNFIMEIKELRENK